MDNETEKKMNCLVIAATALLNTKKDPTLDKLIKKLCDDFIESFLNKPEIQKETETRLVLMRKDLNQS